MDYDQAVAYLDRHIGWGLNPSLDRIEGLLDMIGNPEDSYPIIHVAGTNGKTSVTRMATMLCVAHGLTTGTFISPHLERVEERVTINATPTTREDFAQAVTDLAAFADIFEERVSHLTYFELTAGLALSWFADQAVDVAVVEVGMGGRWDATNAADGSVAVLTSVGMDHAEHLGDTLEKIAIEKLEIVKPGAALVVGPVPPEVAGLARSVATERNVDLYEFRKDFSVAGSTKALGGWQVDIEGIHGVYEDVYLPLHGRHQVFNLAVAIASVEALTGHALDPEAVVDGIGVLTNPGRMEVLRSDPVVMIDGAHNPDGFRVLGAALADEYPNTRWVVVLGAMDDKDLDGMLPSLAGRVSAVVATAIDSPRATPASELAETARRLLGVETLVELDPAAALDRALEYAGTDGSVLVTGSLYLVGHVRGLVTGSGPAQRNER